MRGATGTRVGARVASPFQSTLPVRGATFFTAIGQRKKGISIHAPRAGSDDVAPVRYGEWIISIHAPRAGSDGMVRHIQKAEYISIHAPRAGSDHVTIRQGYWYTNFNPRSPCGERRKACGNQNGAAYFNPRSPCGERPILGRKAPECFYISIHAPRAGSDIS